MVECCGRTGDTDLEIQQATFNFVLVRMPVLFLCFRERLEYLHIVNNHAHKENENLAFPPTTYSMPINLASLASES